jgi:hypothetical protein
MNPAADEKLRTVAREWLDASPAASACLVVRPEQLRERAVYVLVGTEDELRKTKPDALVDALRDTWEALDKALETPHGVLPPELRGTLANAWQAARFQLDKLR